MTETRKLAAIVAVDVVGYLDGLVPAIHAVGTLTAAWMSGTRQAQGRA
jgi:hypothetical protein